MPAKKRESKKVPDGMKAVYALIPAAEWEAFAEVMKRTGRGLADEVRHALARHAAQPPEIVTPALAAAKATLGEGKKRGRPRKGSAE